MIKYLENDKSLKFLKKYRDLRPETKSDRLLLSDAQ